MNFAITFIFPCEIKEKRTCTHWGNYGNLLTLLWQKFRESNVFTTENTKELIWRNFLWMTVNYSIFNTVNCRSLLIIPNIFFFFRRIKSTFLCNYVWYLVPNSRCGKALLFKRDHDFYGKINIFSVKSTYLFTKDTLRY